MQRRRLVSLLAALTTGAIAGAIVPGALAAPGRPASSQSVSGSKRRRRRRRRRRVRRRVVIGMRLTSLPYGCAVTRVSAGVTFYYCGGIWYKPVYQGTTVIYVVEKIEPGAETEVEFEEEYEEEY